MEKKRLQVFWIKLLSKFLPSFAYSLVKRKLLTPSSSSSKWPSNTVKKVYKTKYGKVRTYTLGKGDCIWLVHGWGNAIQFKPLIDKLAKLGYCCVAIEFQPRQKASNRFISLTQWANAFDIAVRYFDKPTHVIAHGVGASIIGQSLWLPRYQGELTLVSPILDFYTGLTQFFKWNALPMSLLIHLEREVFLADRVKLKKQNVVPAIDNFNGKLAVFYSEQDHTSTVNEINELSPKKNRKITEFKGASVNKIIDSRSLLSTIQPQASNLGVLV